MCATCEKEKVHGLMDSLIKKGLMYKKFDSKLKECVYGLTEKGREYASLG